MLKEACASSPENCGHKNIYMVLENICVCIEYSDAGW